MLGKLRLLLWVGIVVLFLPFFGIPDGWRTVLTIVIGIVLIYLTFSLKRSYKRVKFELRQGAQVQVSDQMTIHG